VYFVFIEFVHAVPWRELVFRRHSSPRTEVFQFVRACGVLRHHQESVSRCRAALFLLFFDNWRDCRSHPWGVVVVRSSIDGLQYFTEVDHRNRAAVRVRRVHGRGGAGRAVGIGRITR